MAKTFKLEKEILNNILERKIISPYNSFETIDGDFFSGNYLCEKNGQIVDYFDIKLIPFSKLYEEELLSNNNILESLENASKTFLRTLSRSEGIMENIIFKILFDVSETFKKASDQIKPSSFTWLSKTPYTLLSPILFLR